jgi:hypothetical protein
MAVNIDKSRDDREAADVEPEICLPLTQVPDRDNAIATNAHIRDDGLRILSRVDVAAFQDDGQHFIV